MNWNRRIAVACIFICAGCNKPAAYQEAPPVKVTTVQPVVKTIPVFLEENGETEAVEQAVVRARVRGILEELMFEPDSLVKKGEPLFQIEQKEYNAAVKSAEALVSAAAAAQVAAKAAVGVSDARISASDAAINVAQADFDRQDLLLKSNSIAQSEWDLARANLDTALAAREGSVAAKTAAEADVTSADASLEKANADLTLAQLNLEWTIVTAPIDGKVTRTKVKRGNLVENGTELIEIVKNDPIWANFNISERFLLNLERNSNRDRNVDRKTIKAELKRSGDQEYLFSGFLDYADPKVDQDTGTLMLRAVFDNNDPEKLLLPGLFVRVRVQIGTHENAIMIPERATGRDQTGSYVFVVEDGPEGNKTAVRKDVTTGSKYEDLIVIESGIDSGDTVIVDGIQRLRPGVDVDPG